LCLLAGLAFARALPSAAAVLLAAVIGLGGVWHATWLAATANADPSLRLAMDVARLAHAILPPGAYLRVVAPSVETEAIAAYLQRIDRSSGDASRAAAVLRDFGIRPPDAERVAAHLPRPPRAVVLPPVPAHLEAVFEDQARAPSAGTPEPIARFRAGARCATLYSSPRNGTR
jgi:hypothetical protein